MGNFLFIKCGNIQGKVDPSIKNFIENWLSGEKKVGLIKDTKARSIWRLSFNNDGLFIKKFEYNGFFQAIGRTLFKSNAKQEFDILSRLAIEGVDVPKPLGFLEERNGLLCTSSYLITKEIKDAITLKSYVFSNELSKTQKCNLLKSLAEFIQKLHYAKLINFDLHIGNILIQKDNNKINLYLLDVHRAKFVNRLTRKHIINTFAFLFLSMYMFLSLIDLIRLLKYYFAKKGIIIKHGNLKETANRIKDKFLYYRDRYNKSREKRCFEKGSGFDIDNRKDIKIIIRKGQDPTLTQKAQESHFVNQHIKDLQNRSLSVYNDSIFIKEYKYEGFLKKLENILRRSSAERFWFNSNALIIRHITTPVCYALYKGGNSSYLIGEWIKDGIPCNDFMRKYFSNASILERREFIWQLARFIRKMHIRGICHKDLKANNILVKHINNKIEFFVIDLDRVVFRKHLTTNQCLKNLAQLNAAITPPVTITDRLRFFRYYSIRNTSLIRNKKGSITKIMRITLARKHLWP